MLYCLARCVNAIEEVKYKEEWKGKKGIFWYKPTDGKKGFYVARSIGDEVADRLSRGATVTCDETDNFKVGDVCCPA